jgi:hypothetical protein
MGPYCKFCNHRCFTHMPAYTPEHILKAYRTPTGGIPIIATCPGGQQFEKQKVGYCFDDIKAFELKRVEGVLNVPGHLLEVTEPNKANAITEGAYPPGWPRCPACGAPVLDGHITCGSVACDEGGHRHGDG